MELENLNPDMQSVFGPNSPEVAQYTSDTDKYKDQEVNDYEGLAVHCAQGNAFCSKAKAVKYGQTSPSTTAVADVLPNEPGGGYSGYLALFGNKYIAPQLGAGTPNVTRHGYQITNAAGNLVDLNGAEIDGEYVDTPGFPASARSPQPSRSPTSLTCRRPASR